MRKRRKRKMRWRSNEHKEELETLGMEKEEEGG